MSIPPTIPAHQLSNIDTQSGKRPEVVIHAEGQVLVAPLNASLPPRCVLCNEQESTRLTKSFRWYPKRSKVMVGLSTATALYEEARIIRGGKRGRASFGLCASHAAKRRNLITIVALIAFVIVGAAIAFGIMVSKGMVDRDLCMFFYPLAAIACFADLIWAAKVLPVLKLRGFVRDEMRLTGAGQPFLASLAKPSQPLPMPSIPRPRR